MEQNKSDILEVNNYLAKTEELFNVTGSIPIVAIVSGAVRALAGVVQSFAGMILGFIGLAGMLISPKNYKWEHLAKTAFEQFNHGGLNFLRGLGEYLLGLTFFGSIALFVYQGTSPNKFQPSYKYPQKTEAPKQAEREIILN